MHIQWVRNKISQFSSHSMLPCGLILVRELNERLGLEELIEEHLSDSRQGFNKQFTMTDLLRLVSLHWHTSVPPE